jgi:hypothetical protein
MVVGSFLMADPPMAAGLVQYNVESCVLVLIKSEFFRATLCGNRDKNVRKGGELGWRRRGRV